MCVGRGGTHLLLLCLAYICYLALDPVPVSHSSLNDGATKHKLVHSSQTSYFCLITGVSLHVSCTYGIIHIMGAFRFKRRAMSPPKGKQKLGKSD